MQEKGTISIHTENIFPIIKKFLYSDHEIFLRELVSNAIDATQKISRLASIGEFKGELGELKVEVKVDKKAKTLTVVDRGIGMTADEVKKYINQIAFSGAAEFVEKYKDKGEDKQIIGMFGLGFYSAFMVAKKVEIKTLSYQEGSEAAFWICDGSTEFEIGKADKKERGTEVILHLAEDSEEFLEDYRISQILNKYCKFMPVPIVFGKREETVKNEEDKEEKVEKEQVINNTTPLWTRQPSELKDEDYLAFYKELYPFSEDPLFWIHLNVDYPFNLTGILYFPKVKNELDVNKNKIQLYSRQVFITEEVKDVVPEFLMLLHGVIDSPDIPLNVSRSFLQSDGNVKKINAHITKKVADKLNDLFKKDRKIYEEKWSGLNVFVKYGIISDEKFWERAKTFVLLQNTEDKYFTLDEYTKHIESAQKDKDGNHVYIYSSNASAQDAFIKSAQKKGYDVLKLDGILDNHFINQMEMKLEKTRWKRVDSETSDRLVESDEKKESVLSKDEEEKIKKIFEDAIGNSSHTVTIESLPVDEMPVVLTLPEFMRRMKDMSALGGGMAMMGDMPLHHNVIINGNHSLISKILIEPDDNRQKELALQAYDLGMLAQNMLNGKRLTDFIQRSAEMMSK
ncbi:MAG: molecular chaperone HtpG [Cyclobacteriaceae bacterium]|nr:molecular chaperone HtpG [Cyclobacteriaceae bacterium]